MHQVNDHMNLHTFKASTMSAAFALMKAALGREAVILHTRTYQQRYWMGIRRREVVEITAGRGINIPDRKSRITPARNPAGAIRTEAQIYAKSSTASPVSAGGPSGSSRSGSGGFKSLADSKAGFKAILETPAAGNALMMGLQTEMNGLKTMVHDLVGQIRREQTPNVPEDLFEHYRLLLENQVAEELACEIIKNVKSSIRPEHATQTDFIRDKIAEQLEKLIPVSGPIKRTKKEGPHIVALIGPTGVGKTTTIAKLAANLQIRERQRVGLITIDTFRIAAIDQLKKYADIIGSPLKAVSSPEDLREAIEAMAMCDFILIDTAGRSPNDTLKLNELKNFLSAAAPDEVHLVLSSTGSQQSVELAISRFSDVGADKIIFTKLDEAAHLGVMLNVVRKVNKALSYVTTGQDVPDDIEDCKGKRLAQLILGGRL